ncbi:hypothetical protein LPJ61_002918 [Coemansia biformis]|uniref:Uncharacterized protein n=1 Tax=Coemansia biformis TaxID=1286918 RepID=A0A9W7YE21_9FUNG|nr:hypothetical protein LPJ61_002918 [Coemansia biformis]
MPALDTPVHVGLQAGPAVLEAAAVPGMLSVASAIDSCPAASLYSVHAGPDASAPTASAAVLDADVGSAEKRPEKPLGELASSSGGSEPIKALPSMAAHAVGGALTAAK